MMIVMVMFRVPRSCRAKTPAEMAAVYGESGGDVGGDDGGDDGCDGGGGGVYGDVQGAALLERQNSSGDGSSVWGIWWFD